MACFFGDWYFALGPLFELPGAAPSDPQFGESFWPLSVGYSGGVQSPDDNKMYGDGMIKYMTLLLLMQYFKAKYAADMAYPQKPPVWVTNYQEFDLKDPNFHW